MEGERVKKQPAVYILASKRNGTLYIGVTSNLIKRVWHHRNITAEGFSSRYATNRLVYFEFLPDMPAAIAREKRLKNWHRAWKMRIIEEKNPQWLDLWNQIIQ
jgi:putative endonuclease